MEDILRGAQGQGSGRTERFLRVRRERAAGVPARVEGGLEGGRVAEGGRAGAGGDSDVGGEFWKGLWSGAAGARATLTALNAVRPLPIRLIDATPERCLRAAEVKAKHRLYYADSFAAALAIEHKAALVTGDLGFRRLGHGVAVVWLKG